MSEQKPSLGRMVIYARATEDPATNGADHVPAVIVRVWSDTCVNLKVLNDGMVDFWVTSAIQGDQPRQWDWPQRV